VYLRKASLHTCLLLLLPFATFLQSYDPAYAAPTATVVIDPGNVSSYSGSGTTVASIGSNSLTGTMSNVTYNAANGGKFLFNGTSSSISFSAFDFTNTFSIVAWVKPTSQSQISTLISNAAANGSTNGFKAYWNSWNTSDRKLIAETGNGSSGIWTYTDSASVTFANWQQVAYVFNRAAGTATFYLNGVAQAAAANAIRTDFGTNQSWWIGSMSGSNYWMNGELGVFKIYTSTLNQSDIATEFSSTATRYGIPVYPNISSNPANSSVPSGNTANFSVTSSVSDAGTLSYQWQVSADSGSTWSNVTNGTGGTTNSYTTASTNISINGYRYRVIVTNTLSGNTSLTTSAAATLTVSKATPTIGLSIPIGATTVVTYRATVALTLTSNAPGKIGLKANGRWVPSCRNLDISSSVVCNFKPSLHGQIAMTVNFVPTSTANYSTVVTAPAYLAASARTNKR
jgi:hypothetical protein